MAPRVLVVEDNPVDGVCGHQPAQGRSEHGCVPVMVLTSFAMRGDDRKVREARGDAYLTKPLDTKKFRETLRRFLSRGAGR